MYACFRSWGSGEVHVEFPGTVPSQYGSTLYPLIEPNQFSPELSSRIHSTTFKPTSDQQIISTKLYYPSAVLQNSSLDQKCSLPRPCIFILILIPQDEDPRVTKRRPLQL